MRMLAKRALSGVKDGLTVTVTAAIPNRPARTGVRTGTRTPYPAFCILYPTKCVHSPMSTTRLPDAPRKAVAINQPPPTTQERKASTIHNRCAKQEELHAQSHAVQRLPILTPLPS